MGENYNFFVDGHLLSAQRRMLQDKGALKHRSVTLSCIALAGKKSHSHLSLLLGGLNTHPLSSAAGPVRKVLNPGTWVILPLHPLI